MTREEVVQAVRTYLVPAILESHRACKLAYEADRYNTAYSFGCQFYSNSWERIKELVAGGETPFRFAPSEDGNALICGEFYIRHHRADPKTRLPRCARRAKSEAIQLSLFADELMPRIESGSKRLLLASVTSPQCGLELDILLGPLSRSSSGELTWFEPETISLLDTRDALAAVEEIASPTLTLRGGQEESVEEPKVSLRPQRSKAVVNKSGPSI